MLTAGSLMLLGTALVDDPASRRLGAAGLVAFGLGLAASTITPGLQPPPAFLNINFGLLLLGTALCLASFIGAGRGARGFALVGPLVGAVGALLAGRAMIPRFTQAGAIASLGTAAAVAAIGWTLGRLAPRTGVGEAIRRREREAAAEARAPAALAGVAIGVGAAGFGNHIPVVVLGAVVSGWAAWLSIPAPARPRPAAPLLIVLLLGAAYWLLAAIAGPEGLSLSAIPSLPLSSAAERLIAPLLFGAAWALSGLWPLRQPADGALTAPVGALLLLRLGMPSVPAGLEHWRAALFPVVVLGIWHAAVTRRVTALVVGGALLGLASLQPGGVRGAGWLLASAVALELTRQLPARATGAWTATARGLMAAAAGWGALAVVRAGLQAEVVYTVLAAAAAALGLAGRPVRALTPPPAGSIFGPETR